MRYLTLPTSLSKSSALLSLFMPSVARLHSPAEIIDDSEPERVQLRRINHKRKTTKLHDVALLNSHYSRQGNPVIEISDSDSYSSGSICVTSVYPALETSTAIVPPCIRPPGQGDGISSAKTLNLSRFVYPKPTEKKKMASLPRKPASLLPLSPSESTAAPPFSNTKQTNLGLSLSDLAKISRCVCCDISWTTRKTGHQKVVHMKNCARKHAFDEETMQILLQTEVRNFIPVSKGKARVVSKEPASMKTFLEDVLVNAAPKQKATRQQPESRILNVSQTRVAVLARAQEILAGSSNHDDNSRRELDHCSFGQYGSVDGSTMSPSTHDFGQSSLARIYGSTSKKMFTATYSPSPPVHAGEHLGKSDSTPGPHCIRVNEADFSRNLDLSEGIPSNAGNRFSVSVQDAGESEIMVLQCNMTPEQLRPTLKQRRQSKTDGLADSVVTSLSPKNKDGRKALLKASKDMPVFDEQWELHMKTQISQDFHLLMQVLRFEPVHFNVFLELAMLYAPCSNKLKVQLRNFLDKQAIHFYEGLPWARKRT